VELDFAAFAASAGIAAPTNGTRTAKANRDFKLNMLASLFKGKDDQAKLFPHYVDAGHLSGIRAGSIVVPRTCPKSNAQGSMPTRADLRIGLAFVYAKTADWSVA